MATSRAARPARKPRDQYHHGDLRRALLTAAVRTLQKQGFAALTLRAVGDELGVSRSALYRHFADKSALLTAVASEGFRMLGSTLRHSWESNGKGARGFQAQGEAYVNFALENPWHYRVMFGSGFEIVSDDAELNANGKAAFGALVEALLDLQARGLARREDPQSQANFAWAAVHGVAMLAIDGNFGRRGTEPKQVARYTVERIGAALAPG